MTNKLIKVFDNFLSEYDFSNIRQKLMHGSFPWYFNNTKVKDTYPENINNYQFTHLVYDDYVPRSDLWEDLDPIISRLNAQAWVRIKCNLTPRMDDIYVYGMHQDIDNFNGITGVFYVNDNDGYTEFDNGSKIESVANRMVLFDSSLMHSGTSCTNSKVRCAINFNFIPNPEFNFDESDAERMIISNIEYEK